MFKRKGCNAVKRRNYAFMAELIYRFVKQQNQGRQDSHNRYDADNNALCHNYAYIKAERQRHKAHRKETENRRQ